MFSILEYSINDKGQRILIQDIYHHYWHALKLDRYFRYRIYLMDARNFSNP